MLPTFASMVELFRVSRPWTFELSSVSRKLPLLLSRSSFSPPLTKRPLSPLRYLKNALIATYTQREVILQGPSMVLILHNGAWTLLKATAISYVPRWRRNKDCSELFSGPRKTKAFIQVRRLRSRTSASVKPDNLGERFYVKRGSRQVRPCLCPPSPR